MLIQKMFVYLNLRKHCRLIHVRSSAKLFMFARLPQIRAITRAIDGDLALLPTALRANSPMQRGTKALLLAKLANGTTHARILGPSLFHGELDGRLSAIIRREFRLAVDCPAPAKYSPRDPARGVMLCEQAKF